ncbi:MAG: tetratricopeptide repeat protein [Candidatus Auribacter fodinae]|jgi:tetratricopeptide (TPR) repeat protein|uniref:Tetratricopeptide repeat protein n=1 Tax=Candidatus Auribacter fodinae TaxID=2093366 RepID=A0A3A4QV94_9BACT|nr:MAG: tetratricopeptide repeat protein [Candidatus Auribacter fodinae]
MNQRLSPSVLILILMLLTACVFAAHLYRKKDTVSPVISPSALQQMKTLALQHLFQEGRAFLHHDEDFFRQAYSAIFSRLPESGGSPGMLAVPVDKRISEFDKTALLSGYTAEMQPEYASARVEYDLGNLAFIYGSFQEAQTFYETACSLDKTNPDYLFMLATVYDVLNKSDLAVSMHTVCLEMRESTCKETSIPVIQSYFAMGTAYIGAGKYQKALECLTKAKNRLESVKKHKQKFLLGCIYNNIGYASRLTGDTNTAVQACRKALDIFNELYLGRPTIALANTHINFAETYKALEQYMIARNEYKKAYDTLSALFGGELHPVFSRLSYKTGMTHFEINDFHNAAQYFHKCVDIISACNSPDQDFLLVDYYNYLAICYFHINDYEHAKLYFQRSLANLETNAPDDERLIDLYTNLGKTVYRLGETDKAIELYNNSLRIREILGINENHIRFATLYGCIGSAYMQDAQYEDAIKAFSHALAITKRIESPEKQMFFTILYKNLSEAHEKNGNETLAKLYLARINGEDVTLPTDN